MNQQQITKIQSIIEHLITKLNKIDLIPVKDKECDRIEKRAYYNQSLLNDQRKRRRIERFSSI